ncbi:putative serine/threonine-protein phosphatase 6 regulatory ankyrin repeat subunit C-like isoform X2 [Capsicum annuum]|nr:putative serine/threonine-protein phosphatase 6 regulatory ankyrin repeat subunit C-like isoform X2 [Capsicum annuum]
MESEKPSVEMKEKELFKAAECGDSSLFKSLTEHQLIKALSLRNEDARSLLHVAVSSGHTQRQTLGDFFSFVLALVDRVTRDIVLVEDDRYPVDLDEVVKILAAADPSASGINSGDEEGWVPLHSAASSGNVEIVEILLNRGADVNQKNDGGRTALHYAASKGRAKIAELLISPGAKINAKDKVGCTPLHRAASTGNSELCELLIEEGAEVDEVDKAGETPLMTAVVCGNKEVALLLIRHGANVDIEDKEGYTVLGRASNDLRPILVDAAKVMLEG